MSFWCRRRLRRRRRRCIPQAINQLFFSRDRAIYLLVIDLSQPMDLKRVVLWLGNIAFRAPGAVVRLVGTKIDRCKDGKAIRALCDQIVEAVRKAISELQANVRARVRH